MKGNRMYSLSVMAIACLLALALAQPLTAQGNPKNCSVSVTTTFRDDSGDAVRSDGGGSYPSGFGCDGSYGLSSERGFFFQLNNPTSPGNTFTLVTPSPVAANLGVEIASDGGFTSMDVGTSEPTTKIQFNFVSGKSRYFLRWGSNYPGASTATVTRTAADTWVIETSPAPNNIAILRQCPAKGACKTPIDRSYYAPLQMTLVSQ